MKSKRIIALRIAMYIDIALFVMCLATCITLTAIFISNTPDDGVVEGTLLTINICSYIFMVLTILLLVAFPIIWNRLKVTSNKIMLERNKKE